MVAVIIMLLVATELFVTGFPAFLTAISAPAGTDASILILHNVHEGIQFRFAFGGAE
jgi:hypothetical protein